LGQSKQLHSPMYRSLMCTTNHLQGYSCSLSQSLNHKIQLIHQHSNCTHLHQRMYMRTRNSRYHRVHSCQNIQSHLQIHILKSNNLHFTQFSKSYHTHQLVLMYNRIHKLDHRHTYIQFQNLLSHWSIQLFTLKLIIQLHIHHQMLHLNFRLMNITHLLMIRLRKNILNTHQLWLLYMYKIHSLLDQILLRHFKMM